MRLKKFLNFPAPDRHLTNYVCLQISDLNCDPYFHNTFYPIIEGSYGENKANDMTYRSIISSYIPYLNNKLHLEKCKIDWDIHKHMKEDSRLGILFMGTEKDISKIIDYFGMDSYKSKKFPDNAYFKYRFGDMTKDAYKTEQRYTVEFWLSAWKKSKK